MIATMRESRVRKSFVAPDAFYHLFNAQGVDACVNLLENYALRFKEALIVAQKTLSSEEIWVICECLEQKDIVLGMSIYRQVEAHVMNGLHDGFGRRYGVTPKTVMHKITDNNAAALMIIAEAFSASPYFRRWIRDLL